MGITRAHHNPILPNRQFFWDFIFGTPDEGAKSNTTFITIILLHLP